MGRWIHVSLLVGVLLAAHEAVAGDYVVQSGDTLTSIARAHHTRISALCGANGLSRQTTLRVGQSLAIPEAQEREEQPGARQGLGKETSAQSGNDGATTRLGGDNGSVASPSRDGLQHLDVPGVGSVPYYEPKGKGSKGLRPVLIYLHGRGGDPEADCRKWAKVARPMGWLVCPAGAGYHENGRTWNNDWGSGRQIVMRTLQSLRGQYGRRVQLRGNTIIGFSEGAFVAMNVGLAEPKAFSRWLILGASDTYWGGDSLEQLRSNSRTIRRVYLITGERDVVVDRTRKVGDWLKGAKVTNRLQTPDTLAHEVAVDRMPSLYSRALTWLSGG
jgi:predicted esterase/LysM repeat protein